MKVAIVTVAVAALTTAVALAEDAAPWRPEFIKTNTKAQLAALLPPRALAEGVSGEASLECVAADKGKLTQCTLLEEDPAGYGFGDAALKAVLNERIKPKDRQRKSVVGRPVTTTFAFLAPGDSNADWLRKPNWSDLAAVLPVAAVDKGVDGRATMRCGVTVEGFLAQCQVASETPEGMGYGAAALQLAPQFRMTPKIRGGKAVASSVLIPLTWSGMEEVTPAERGRRLVLDPPWITVATAEDMKRAWPAKRTEKAASASVRCRLTATGELKRCEKISEEPQGKGFGRAAEVLAREKFTVRVAPENAADVDDYSVDIPFRFRNPAEPDTRVVAKPKWITTLSPESVALVFPAQATAAGLSQGRGTVNCVVGAHGDLSDCKVVSEEPAALGFGEAAVKAVGYMKMNPWSADGDPLDGLRVTLPIRLMLTGPEPETSSTPAQ